MDRKVSTANLKVGMYVSSLDRSWKETPFLVQGFFIEDESHMLQLVRHCDYVYIDTDMGEKADMYLDSMPTSAEMVTKQRMASNQRVENILHTGRKLAVYKDLKTTVEEIPAARTAMSKAAICIAEVVESSIRKGEVNVDHVREAVDPIVSSVIRNSDAYLWLSKMQQHDHYSYQQSVQNCGLGIAFGRHIGMSRKDLSTFGIGLLLMDIGKVRLPRQLLTSEKPLNKVETAHLRKHVAYSVDILRNAKGISDQIVNIALTHHERFDGSGYPNGLVGVQTPVLGRMAGIIDCYNTMITSAPYRNGIPEHQALQNIYNLRDKLYQGELVEQFIKCMGVYPTGSLVELTSGAVAAVLSQNLRQKMKPKLLMLLDEKKRPVRKRKIVDLTAQGSVPLFIARSLEQKAYGIDMRAVKF